jgi:serralysin
MIRILSSGGAARTVSAVVASFLAILAAAGGVGPQRDTGPEPIAAATVDPDALRIFCFDSRNPPDPDVMDWINSLVTQQVLDYQLSNQVWANNGTPVTLTWSFVPDGVMLPGLGSQAQAPSELFSRMNQRFGNNQALWISLFDQAFTRWGQLTGITFVRVTSGANEWDNGTAFPTNTSSSTHGHFRIGMRALDGAGGVLAFNYFPPFSDMVIDSSENWASSSGNYRFLRNVLMHEMGHGLGMAHCCPINQSKLLEPTYSSAYDGPQHDDVRGIHQLHGDFYEPNNNLNVATSLGQLNVGQTLLPSSVPGASFNFSSRTSIDRLADQDWFRFDITGPMNLNVTVTPVGHDYLSGPQLQGGACSAGTSINSLTAADLAVQVFGPNSSTLLATAASNPIGLSETISNLPLGTPGAYYVRVYATTANAPQLYRLQISATTGGAGACPSFTTDPLSGSVCFGGQLILNVVVAGNPAPTLQWRRNGVIIPGQTGTSYIIASASQFSSGDYDVVATNSCGVVISDVATVTVIDEPEILQHPISQVVSSGAFVSLVADSTGSPLWRWFKNNQVMEGQTASSLIFESVSLGDAGSYYAEAYNNCGSALTSTAVLTVNQTCYANCDGSTQPPILNVDDFTCFINSFAAAQTLPVASQITAYANCDGSTTVPILNVDDFTCFINRFAQGCP